MSLPKRAWSYWETGQESAPDIVHQCWESWRRHNPEFKMEIIDQDSIGKYTILLDSLDLFRDDITVQKRSNLVRLALMQQYGGVWVDSTLYCTRSLDAWLPPLLSSGCFAFRNEKKARDVCNWFLAAMPGNPLIGAWLREYLRIFVETHYTLQNSKIYKPSINILSALLNRNTSLSKYWVHPWVRNTIKMYPYFNAHFTFNKIVADDPAVADVWQKTPTILRECSRHLGQVVRSDAPMHAINQSILDNEIGVHKLNWRSDYENPRWAYALEALQATQPGPQ